jgi:hypothetical protein
MQAYKIKLYIYIYIYIKRERERERERERCILLYNFISLQKQTKNILLPATARIIMPRKMVKSSLSL